MFGKSRNHNKMGVFGAPQICVRRNRSSDAALRSAASTHAHAALRRSRAREACIFDIPQTLMMPNRLASMCIIII